MYYRTEDYLRFNANFRSDAVALINQGCEITYPQFYRDLRKLTQFLRRLGLRRESSVAVSCDDRYVHWLLLLGFEALGMVTASFSHREGAGCRPLLDYVDHVFSDADLPFAVAKPLHRITADWINGILLYPEIGDPADDDVGSLRPDDPMRIVRSSGTTGGMKMMLKTRHMNEVKIEQLFVCSDCSRGSHCLFVLPFTVNGVYIRAMALLRGGATAIFADGLDTGVAISRYRPTSVHLMPLKLAEIVRNLPRDFVKPPSLIIETSGAAVPDEVRAVVLRRLAGEICNVYGTNEVNLICYLDADGVGIVSPWAEVEIVDEDSMPLPLGAVGRIRAKTLGMVDGYIDNPEATAATFRDGWFYTGDVGVMEAPGKLRPLGRHDELMNVGGLKLSPDDIEDRLRRDGVLDGTPLTQVAVTSIKNSTGMEEICVAVVGAREVEVEQLLLARIGAGLPAFLGNVRVLWLDSLPVMESGKLNRRVLAGMVRAMS